MMRNRLFIFLFLGILSACSNNTSVNNSQDKTINHKQIEDQHAVKEAKLEQESANDKILPTFKKNYFVKGKAWTFNENNFLVDPYYINYNSGKLILIDVTNEYNLKYIDVNKRDTIISFGKRGKGPFELGLVEQVLKIDKDSLSVWDYRKQMIFTFSLSEVKHGKTTASSYRRVRNKDFVLFHLVPEDTDNFICNSYSVFDASLFTYNVKNNRIEKILDYPFAEHYLTSRKSLALIMQAQILKYKNFVLSVFRSTPVIRIFKIENKKISLVNYIHGDAPKILPVTMGDIVTYNPLPENINGFLFPYASERYFIIPYRGRTAKDYPKGDKVFYSNHLLVYNWQGKPLFVLTLDEDCSAITYDEQNKVLYTVARNDDSEPYIREYHVDIEKLIQQKQNEK